MTILFIKRLNTFNISDFFLNNIIRSIHVSNLINSQSILFDYFLTELQILFLYAYSINLQKHVL